MAQHYTRFLAVVKRFFREIANYFWLFCKYATQKDLQKTLFSKYGNFIRRDLQDLQDFNFDLDTDPPSHEAMAGQVSQISADFSFGLTVRFYQSLFGQSQKPLTMRASTRLVNFVQWLAGPSTVKPVGNR